jgi:protein-S-isoprenylcysteine O-methyltransferase Ste14
MKVNLKLLTVEIAFLFGVIGLALFLAAGTLVWPAGWVFWGSFFIFTLVLTRWLISYNPGLLTERMTGMGKEDQKSWDKVFYLLANIYFLAWIIIMPLDSVRFQWTLMPVWMQALGGVMLLVSYFLFFPVFRENSFLSPAVRLQTERQQSVVSSGPYHYVRHPMYSTAILFLTGTSLLLGSWIGLLMEMILVLGIAFRAVQEERTLQAELPGYSDYMNQVKYRLIPFVW